MTTWVGKPHLSILGGKEEDRFTQYLCELLRSPTILRAFITEACNLDVTVDETTLARTQVTVPGGRPDLAIRGKYLYLLFEAKVGAWLHEDQLRPYAQELDQWLQRQPSGTASLFVLTPQRNLTGILQSAQRELSEAGLDHIHPVGMCWEQVVVLFQTLASQVDDPRLALHLGEFSEIVLYRLGEPSRPFTREESQLLQDPLAARSIRRARLLVDHVVEILRGRGLTFSGARGFLWDGFTVKYNGRNWWYGLWIDAWAEVGFSPIFLQLYGFSNRAVPPIPEGLPLPLQFKNTEQLVALPIRDGVDLDVLAAEQAQIIWRFTTELPESGTGQPGVAEDTR